MAAPPSPTARALETLTVLQTRPGITAGELGARLGVSERAARRYVAILREAGLSVESARGPYGGYRLGRGARPYPLVFTEGEALGLVMAVLDGHAPAAAGDEPVGAALDKVIGALPEGVGGKAAELRRHAMAVPDRRAAPAAPAVTGALVAAAVGHRQVRVLYRNGSGDEWEAEVDPWAVVVRHGLWYLLCHSARAGAVRTYRVDRVRAVRPTGRTFTPPDGLDPVATLEEHLGRGWEFPTRVRFEAPVAEVAEWVRPPMGRLEPGDGGCVLTGSTNNPAMYAQEWLAPLPFPFRVEAGPELRAAVAAVAARFAAAVDDEAGEPSLE